MYSLHPYYPFINKVGSYVITGFHLKWHRSQLYFITEMIPLLVQFTLASPQSHAVITI